MNTVTHPQELAQALYPSAPVDKSADRRAAEFDATAPAHIVEMRAQDPARILYGTGGLREVKFERAFDGNKALANELRNVLADYGISDHEGQRILGRAVASRVSGPGNVQAQQQTARHRLTNDHGNADEALALANQLINRDSRMVRLLSSMGVGSDPDVVSIFADAARRERQRGRL